jgi:pullulanase-type alpha-1,6-glucosidase
LTLEADGVDGPAIYVYGEGWNFGEVADNARGVNAVQRNMAGTGIGSFNDRLRDGARGGGPFSGLQEQGFVSGLYVDPNATPQGSPADQLARLLLETDWIRVGLAGSLAGYELTDRFGNLVRGDQIDYNGQPAGYTADPQEVINYVEAHDNETLFDALQAKLPLSTPLAERARVQSLGMDLVALGQGVPFFHAGVDLLRSKSMDRNSYDSGDWFNRLDFTYQTNNWGVGLPPARDNQGNWPLHQALLADPALAPGPAEIAGAVEHFREALAIRKSSPLFRLGTAPEVAEHLSFHNTGPGQTPALVVMELADPAGAVDRPVERIVVLFNARPEPVEFTLPALAGAPLALHPVQAASADPWTSAGDFDPATGTFSVPERTTAVFVQPRPVAEQLRLLIGDVDALIDAGALPRVVGLALKIELKLALFHWQAGRERPARALVAGFIHQLGHLVDHGVLTEEQAEPVIEAARAAFAAMGG